MEDERVISFERGKQLAEQLGVEFFETSAKENINVKVSRPVQDIFSGPSGLAEFTGTRAFVDVIAFLGGIRATSGYNLR